MVDHPDAATEQMQLIMLSFESERNEKKKLQISDLAVVLDDKAIHGYKGTSLDVSNRFIVIKLSRDCSKDPQV